MSDRLIYIPDRLNGQSEFRGECIVSSDAYDLLLEEGVDFIKKKLNEIVDYKKQIYGFGHIGYYGLHFTQRFYDLKNRIGIEVKEIIGEGVHQYTEQETLFWNETPSRDFEINLDNRYPKNYKSASNASIYNTLSSGRSYKSVLKDCPYKQ